MTLDELCLAVSIKTGLDDTAASEDRLSMEGWANEGVQRVLLKTHIYVDEGTAALTAGETVYRLDSDIIAIVAREIVSASGTFSFVQTDLETVLDIRRRNLVEGTHYFALSGHDLLIVAPPPASGDTITFLFVPLPAEMTSGSHDPADPIYGGIPVWAHKAIELYMMWQAAERLDKEKGLDLDKARGAFEAECAEIRKRMRQKAGRGLAPGRVGYPGRRVRTRNDVYYPGM